MTYRYTYKIVCLLGKSFKGHYYLGQHTTNNLNDGYCGSGKKLQRYFKKYGAVEGETYIKEIIQFCNSQEDLNKAEYELIGDKYDTDPMCMNLRAGGMQCGASEESRKQMRISSIGKGNANWVEGYSHTEEECQKMREKWHDTHKSICGKGSRGPRKELTRLAISKSTKGIKKISTEQADEQRVFMIGRKWMNNGVQEIHVSFEDIDEYLIKGWQLGRIQKHKIQHND